MKKCFCLFLTLILTFSFACAAMAADLVIYSARNERLNNVVIPAFEAETGLTVEMITGSTSALRRRLKAAR